MLRGLLEGDVWTRTPTCVEQTQDVARKEVTWSGYLRLDHALVGATADGNHSVNSLGVASFPAASILMNVDGP